MSIGIDKIGFATSQYVLNMADLALARGAEPEKFRKGLMLDATSITPITEDIVTLASDAAADILNDDDKKAIDMVIVATESSIDQSKAAAVYVHSLLGIQPFARSFEMKEACYAVTTLNCTWQPTQIARFWLSLVILPAMVWNLLGSQLKELVL